MNKITIAFLIISLSLLGLEVYKKYQTNQKQDEPEVPDDSTLSNILDFQTKHFHLDIEIDFSNKSLFGTQTLTMIAQNDGVNQVNLDVSGLKIKSIMDQENNTLSFNYHTPTPNIFGEQLQISLKKPSVKGQQYNYTITYLSENPSAASWLNPEQTASQTLPYMYTSCQTVTCRSLAPFQDTPYIKQTYTANVLVVDPIVVYLSANVTGSTKVVRDNKNYTNFSFRSDIPIATYVFTIVAGNVVEQSLGKRTSVISEPTNIQQYADELSDLELYLQTIENYTTPYVWGSYKIVIQPPSFPMGGMENPLLTFASPSIIVGDKSGVSVAVHEIAHSWTGNLVTCKNWRNLWINEGFTMFLERKADSVIFGQDYALIDSIVGNDTMIDDMKNFGFSSNYTSLYPITKGANPDDSFSNVPYEKGYQFLKYIESIVGEDFFQQFLRSYLIKYSLQSIDYQELKIYFNEYVQINRQRDAEKIIQAIDWESWVTNPGLPPINLNFSTPTIPQIKQLAQNYIDLKGITSPDNYRQFFTYSMNEKCIFLQYIFEKLGSYDATLLKKLDEDYYITFNQNKEILWRWFRIAIRTKYSDVDSQIDTFVGSIGRIKMVSPIYQAYIQSGQKDIAKTLLQKYQSFYHPMTVIAINRIMNQSEN